MPPSEPVEAPRKFFTVEGANRTLPLVKQIVGDVVRQFKEVEVLRQRLRTLSSGRRGSADDASSEEVERSQAAMDSAEQTLVDFIEELSKLGVELKGPDGLCDFPCIMDGREVFLCWRLGEPEVMHWHEIDAGVAGRQPISTAGLIAGSHP